VTTQRPIARRIDLNIAVERGRLEEGEDFQLALPAAMFFYSQVECLLSLFGLLTVK
jgi:hypothetical protein